MVEQYAIWAQTKVFAERVERAQTELRHAASNGSIVVAVSWGKDSCALAHLAVETLGRIPLMHIVSPYELPGNERIVKYFCARTTVHMVPAKRSLQETIDWLRENGLGYERVKLRGSGKKRKADAGIAWVHANGYRVQALGLRAEESKGRRACFRVRGLTYQAHGLTITNPIGWWTVRDVWAYLVSREVPWHPLYDRETHGQTRETLRNSGWLTLPSSESDYRVGWLRQHYPEQYRMLTRSFPQVRSLG